VQDLIWLLPTFPLLGFLSLVLTRGNMHKKAVAAIGAGSIGLSFITAALIAVEFLGSGETHFVLAVLSWIAVGEFNPGFSFYLDGLSLVMMLVITCVGFLFDLYWTVFVLVAS